MPKYLRKFYENNFQTTAPTIICKRIIILSSCYFFNLTEQNYMHMQLLFCHIFTRVL